MASPTNPSTQAMFSGLFKEVYIDSGVVDLVPNATKLVKEVPFEKGQEIGDKFIVPVVMSDEAGVTYAVAGAGNFAVGGAVGLQMQKVSVDGAQMILQSAIDNESIARAQKGGKAAFQNATQLKVKNVLSTGKKRLEISMWYGQSGLGIIESKANVDGTHETIVITAASWAPLIWVGKRNAKLLVYQGTTQIGSSAGTDDDSTNVFWIDSVNVATRTITVHGASGDITALNSASTSSPAVLTVYFNKSVTGSGGTFAHQDQLGLDQQLVQATGNKFGVSVVTYDLWAGNSYDSLSGALTFSKLMAAINLAVNRGLDSDVKAWISNETWKGLLNDQAALRKYDGSYDPKKMENGASELVFHGVSGKVTVVATGYLKGGDAFILPMDELMRIGAADFAFTAPGAGGLDGSAGDIFFVDPSYAGYLFRAYSHQQVLNLAPQKSVKVINVVNS